MKTVLVVDDNRDAADTLALLLSMKGHKALTAYDAQAGLVLADSAMPDVIIHDIGFADMSGYSAVRKLRINKKLKNTLLVALTGFATANDRDRAISAGFDLHIAKPIDF